MILSDKQIGQVGSSRTTYEHKDNPNWVVKVPNNRPDREKNIQEYKTWELAQKKGLQDWLVPCVECHPTGEWLIMERAMLLEHKKQRPLKEPWMHDAGWKNWGIHNGKKKLLDYASAEIHKRIKQL